MQKVFLTSYWLDVTMLNYEVEPRLLTRYVPRGTVLDSFDGKTYVSLVGLRFSQTKLLGTFAVPFHTDFDEVNLRFYVRRTMDIETRRGVVFIAEIVPKLMVSLVARLIYGENYLTHAMDHEIVTTGNQKTATYRWRGKTKWCSLSAQSSAAPAIPQEDSLEQFISEHYWGYSAQRDGGAMEYRVSHARWPVRACATASFRGDPRKFYGPELGGVLSGAPCSAFIADGSPVTVFKGHKLP